MSAREAAMDAAVKRELAILGAPPRGDHKATLDYLYRLYEGGNRILRTQLPPETLGERVKRWLFL